MVENKKIEEALRVSRVYVRTMETLRKSLTDKNTLYEFININDIISANTVGNELAIIEDALMELGIIV